MLFYAAADDYSDHGRRPRRGVLNTGFEANCHRRFSSDQLSMNTNGLGDAVRSRIHSPRFTLSRRFRLLTIELEALQLCESSGLKLQSPTTGTVGDRAGSAHVSSGIVGDYQREVLSLIGKAWDRDPLEVAAEYFRQSIPGERHYRMVACVGALILRHYDDAQIINALAPVYRDIVPDDASMARLRVCPGRVRRGMRARGNEYSYTCRVGGVAGCRSGGRSCLGHARRHHQTS